MHIALFERYLVLGAEEETRMFEAEVIRVSDALSQHTRSVRKTLLVASTISLTVAMTGLIPTKIDALGVEFSQVDRNSMILLMAAVVAFMLLSFIVTAASDFTAWRISYASRAWDEESRDPLNKSAPIGDTVDH